MSDVLFDMSGMEELKSDIETCLKEYPEKTSQKIYNLAGQFTKDVNQKFPEEYQKGKRPLGKSWKREREKTLFTGYTVRVNISNRAPHFHLVENGHVEKIPVMAYAIHLKNQSPKAENRNKRPWRRKKVTGSVENRGFVPGKHYCERTRHEWREKFPEEVEKFVDKMLKDRKL